MIPKDHGVQPAWMERQERELLERSLPWRQDPEGTWFRDPSPRWRVREEWIRASSPDKARVMKYKLVTGPESALPGQDVHPGYGEQAHDAETDANAKAAADAEP